MSAPSGPDILHVTSAHPVWDTRIFVKEARSLAAAGFRVAVLGPGEQDSRAWQDRVELITLSRPRNRAGRFLGLAWRILSVVRSYRPHVVHLHDPDLLPLGWVCYRLGIRVVYDVHEDFPLALLSRTWIGPLWLRRIIAVCTGRFETWAIRWLSGIILADRQLEARFPPERSVVVRNYPEFSEWPDLTERLDQREIVSCVYVGDITVARGLLRMCDAVVAARRTGLPVHLDLVGPISEADRKRVMAHAASPYVTCHGLQDRDAVARFMAGADIALALFEPTPAYREALGVKILEYITSGLPILATDTPRLRAEPALRPALHLVPWSAPSDVLADAIAAILASDRSLATRQTLRRVIEDQYAWPGEAGRLLQMYRGLFPCAE